MSGKDAAKTVKKVLQKKQFQGYPHNIPEDGRRISMKKTLTVLMMVLLAAMLFISCDNKTKEVVYKVTFESNGGSAVATEEVKAGEKAVKPENPTRKGYTFDKWTTDKDGKYEYAFNSVLEGDITLYAQWIRVYKVGDKGPAGGIVFYVNPNAATDEWTYLEAAPEDIKITKDGTTTSTFVFGYNRTTDTGSNAMVGTGTAIGTGKKNTEDLVAAMGETAYSNYTGSDKTEAYAAKVCADYTCGGYDDWFLPSKDELNEIYKNKASIGNFVDSDENSKNCIYWSSSEGDDCDAWVHNFKTNAVNYGENACDFIHIRAVRSF